MEVINRGEIVVPDKHSSLNMFITNVFKWLKCFLDSDGCGKLMHEEYVEQECGGRSGTLYTSGGEQLPQWSHRRK